MKMTGHRDKIRLVTIVFGLLFGVNLTLLTAHHLFDIGYPSSWGLDNIAFMPLVFSMCFFIYLGILPRLQYLYPIIVLTFHLWIAYPYTDPYGMDGLLTLKDSVFKGIDFIYYFHLVDGTLMEVSVLIFGTCAYELVIIWSARQVDKRINSKIKILAPTKAKQH